MTKSCDMLGIKLLLCCLFNKFLIKETMVPSSLLYIYNFSTVNDFLSLKYSGSTGHGTPGTSREIYSEDADGET